MATSYEECYEMFLGKIDDNDILFPACDETNEEHLVRLTQICYSYFCSAIAKAIKFPTPLKRDNVTKMFENELQPIEIECISLLMLKEYYRKKLNYTAKLTNSASDRDWKPHSPANQMNQYRQMIREIEKEVNTCMNQFSYYKDGEFDNGW